MRLIKAIKSGKLANGMELGKGSIVHFVEGLGSITALCGSRAAISFTARPEKEVTCKKCLKLSQIKTIDEALKETPEEFVNNFIEE